MILLHIAAWVALVIGLVCSNAFILIVRHLAPDASPGQLALKIIVAVLVAHRLITYLRDVWRARP